ncbi:MAG: hypothetical protein RL222_462 [Bacteroidota bacterium]
MKNKFMYLLCLYSNLILTYVAIFVLATVVVVNILYDEIPEILAFLFWLISGVWIGFNLALKVKKVLNNR